MRLFLSINLSEENILQLERWQQELQVRGVKGYWRRRDNLHITLKFLDEFNEIKLDPLIQACLQAGAQTEGFELIITNLGVFPGYKNPRILWVGIDREGGLLKLKQEIEKYCADIGLPAESREYKPHLTLASGGIEGISPQALKWGEGLILKQTVGEFHLMNSIVQKGRRRYEIVQSFQLG